MPTSTMAHRHVWVRSVGDSGLLLYVREGGQGGQGVVIVVSSSSHVRERTRHGEALLSLHCCRHVWRGDPSVKNSRTTGSTNVYK